MTTPKMTHHARVRCVELGITTRRAKRVVQHRTSTYPAGFHNNGGIVVHSASDPEIAVVWDPNTDSILTVLPRVQEEYVRTPDGYVIEVHDE